MKKLFIIALLGISLRAIAFNPSDVDFDGDLSIDVADLLLFSSSWLSHGGPSDDWNPVCDLSSPPDGVIDQSDLTGLWENWLVSIPEPNAFFNAADINDDRDINILDYSVFSAAWLSTNGSAGWNPACDLATPNDGIVDVNDLVVFLSSWLVTLPDPNDYTHVPDLNSDRVVDLLDYDIFAGSWLSDSDPMPNWNPVYNLAGVEDGTINGKDLSVIAAHWGFRIPDPNEFIYIPGGTFQMGDHHDSLYSAQPVHTVSVDSFYMGKYQITHGQYCDYLNSAYASGEIMVVNGTVYSINDQGNTYPYFDTYQAYSYSQIDLTNGTFNVRYKDNVDMSNYPLIEVSWYGAAAYCNWRSYQDGYSSCYDLSTWECNFDTRGFRLATEAQWEYAARGGQFTPYYRYPWGDEVDTSNANYWLLGRTEPIYTVSHPVLTPVGYYDGKQIPVGQDMANGWGLYDMAGNVLEWCNDWHDKSYYSTSPLDNPKGPDTGESKVMRGGSWNNDAQRCRVAYRDDEHEPFQRGGAYGFRIVFGPLPVPK